MLVAGFWMLAYGISAQSKKDTANVIRNASNLASGNFRDVLTSFFQLAYSDLKDKKELKFSSNIFAIKLKTDSGLNITKNFVQQKWARNSNISFSLKLDTAYKFNGFKGGYTYAIVNARDYAIAESFNTMVLYQTRDYLSAFRAIVTEISGIYPENEGGGADRLMDEMNAFFKTGTKTFGQLSDEAKTLVRKFFYTDKIKLTPNWSPRTDMNAIYQALIKEWQKKLLWTVDINGATYTDNFTCSNLDLTTEATAGIIPVNNKNNIEFHAKANYALLDDTLKLGRDLHRQKLTSSFGLNWVARNKVDKPVFEIKAAGELDHVFSGRYLGEKETRFVFNADIRIRITNEIWVPVSIKYDPETGNVFGFLNVRSNFDLLNRVFGMLK